MNIINQILVTITNILITYIFQNYKNKVESLYIL